jgi:hypothetical protein
MNILLSIPILPIPISVNVNITKPRSQAKAEAEPYPLIVRIAFSPRLICGTPSSQPVAIINHPSVYQQRQNVKEVKECTPNNIPRADSRLQRAASLRAIESDEERD